jgi:outer membrane receptor protein involved in Fe transport
MHNKTISRRESGLLSRASALALASATFVAPQVFAQDTDDEILVTGSRIPSANAISASPVTTIGNVEFDIRGTTRVEDLVNTLPQAFAAQGANTSNGATGTAQVDIRGLGSNRTLVLVNGRRLQYGSAYYSTAPDLNQIPAALIERVEVLTGGASAVYGSDAIAGVVNFIMLSDFEGVRIDGQLSGYQHSNNNEAAQAVLTSAFPSPGSDFAIPESGVFDGKGQEITLIIGANSEDGRGNVTAYAGYRNNDAISQADRDYSKCAYAGGDPVFRCSGSSASPNGRFTDFATYNFTLDENNPNQFRPFNNATDLFNFNPTNYYQRPDERYILGAYAHYEVNENLEFYSEATFYDYRSAAQIAFTSTFFTTGQINCDNPLMSDQQAFAIGCTALQRAGADPVSNDISGFYPGKRFVEGEPRRDEIRLTSYRIVGGVRGEIVPGWDYDAYFQYGNTHNSQTYNNDAVIPNIQNALFAVSDGAGGVMCRDALARANGCVPLNLFTIGGVTQNQLDYILQRSFQDGNTRQYLGEITLTADLGQYGMKSPAAEDGIGLAGGFQWRKDQLVYSPDALFEGGLLAGQGGPTPPVSGSIENTDFYVEAEVPLISDAPFAELFKFNGGYRHSDVSTSGSYSTWKLTGDWQITPEIRVRGGWQRAARAANVLEAFIPQAQGLTTLAEGANGLSDPCAGNGGTVTPTASQAACAFTGVTTAQYVGGLIFDNPADQYNAVFGGNPNLDPEISDTYTVGIVVTPGDYVPGNLLLSVDYFDITVDGFVGVITAQDSLDNCLATGDPFFCSLIVRNPNNGSLWTGQTVGFIETNLNTGSLSTSGIDVNANWSFDFNDVGMGAAGGLAFDLVGTYLFDLTTESLPGSVPFDCAGFYAQRCGTPNPEWRHKLRTTWETPLDFDVSVTWRYWSSVYQGDSVNGRTAAPTDEDYRLETRNYIDLAGTYNLTDKWNVTVGVNNLLDKDPPLTTQTAGFSNGNTYPQTYDAQGRYLFVGTTIDF